MAEGMNLTDFDVRARAAGFQFPEESGFTDTDGTPIRNHLVHGGEILSDNPREVVALAGNPDRRLTEIGAPVASLVEQLGGIEMSEGFVTKVHGMTPEEAWQEALSQNSRIQEMVQKGEIKKPEFLVFSLLVGHVALSQLPDAIQPAQPATWDPSRVRVSGVGVNDFWAPAGTLIEPGAILTQRGVDRGWEYGD